MRTIFKWGVLAGALLTTSQIIWASCGSASCPIDTYSAEKTEKGMVRLDYSYEYIDQDQPQIGRHNASVGEIPGHHDEISTLNEVQRIGVDVGLSNRLSLQFVIPFVHREHQHIHNHQGTPILESWNFDGMGDLIVLSRFALANGSSERLSVLAGGVLPTGRDKVLNADGDEAEVGILPGKGATSFILGASYSQTGKAKTLNGLHAALPCFISYSYQWNGKGVHDYKMGNTLLANAGVTYPVFPKLGFLLQSNLRIARKDGPGDTGEEIEKTGGTYVYVSPGFQFTPIENLAAYIYAQFPVYQRVNEIQLTSDTNFLVGLSYRFSVL